MSYIGNNSVLSRLYTRLGVYTFSLLCKFDERSFSPQNWSSLHFLINNGENGPDHNQICTNIFHLTDAYTDKIL